VGRMRPSLGALDSPFRKACDVRRAMDVSLMVIGWTREAAKEAAALAITTDLRFGVCRIQEIVSVPAIGAS